jgi:hypothetical protein
VTPHELKVGCAYYQVTFADRDLTIPSVDALIYVGVNVFDSDVYASGPMHTFQDTLSYFRYGLFNEYQGSDDLTEEGLVTFSFTTEQLKELTDLRGATEVMCEALERLTKGER